MITWCIPSTEEGREVTFVDSMLTTDQAKRLIERLNKVLEENNNNE